MSKMYFRYGAMNCGKSTHLLQVAHNYEENGLKVCLIKSSIDTKGEDHVVSRLGCERTVDILLKNNEKVFEKVDFSNEFSCILVDEAQFLTKEQVEELYLITKQLDIPVICYGLRCDFKMQGFEGASRLLEIADSIEEMKTICTCGNKATQNMRLVSGVPTFTGEQVAIDNGENEVSYKPVCGKCYILTRNKVQS